MNSDQNESDICFIPDILRKLIEFFNPFKIHPEELRNSIVLYEENVYVMFINQSPFQDSYIPTIPVEMEGGSPYSLGPSMTVSRKVSYDDIIKLMLTFEDNIYFGDTHKLVDGVVYFRKNKYTVTKCILYKNLTVGDKTYGYLVQCVIT